MPKLPSLPPSADRQRGFTLIELLVVISILAILAGMLMPILGLANREAKKSATRTVMVKVDTALRLFRSEIGPYPYQKVYDDFSWNNRLYYHLGTDITDDNRTKVLADAEAAAACYTNGDPWTTPPNLNSYRAGDSREGWGASYIANRMGRERVRLAIYSGNTAVTSGVMKEPYASWRDYWGGALVRRKLPTTPMLTMPKSEDCPGWAKDYLRGEVQARFIDGEAILDAWHRPLIYVCRVVEGMHSVPCIYSDSSSTDLSALHMGLHPVGRTTLAPVDAITENPLVADPLFLPDISNLRHSDRRRYAPRTLELEFELWSAGPDGMAEWMRDAVVNADNVPLQAYDKGIP